MVNIIDEMVQDLSNYSYNDINTLARYYGVPRDLRTIAKLNLGERFQAKMYGKTFHSSQIDKAVNIMNSKVGRNICLRTALVVTHYTFQPKRHFNTIHLDIEPQESDIYKDQNITLGPVSTRQGLKLENMVGETKNPFPMIDEIIKIDANRFCFFVIWVLRNEQKAKVSSHITLTLCESENDTYNIYNYNSGFRNEREQYIFDTDLATFFNLVKQWQVKFNPRKVQYKIVPSISWCPLLLQGSSNICTVFVFNIYYYLNKYPDSSIQKILKDNVQEMSNILEFLKELQEDLTGASKHDIKLE